MIELERMNGDLVLVNPDHIRFVEACPDCLITFFDGKTLLVKTALSEIKTKIFKYKSLLGAAWTQQQYSDSPLA